jgi:hypothetical protein
LNIDRFQIMATDTFQVFSEDQQGGQTYTFISAVNDIPQYIGGKGVRSCIITGTGLWQIFSDKDHRGVPNVLKAGKYHTPAGMGMLDDGAKSTILQGKK